jgi:hypothetical protein
MDLIHYAPRRAKSPADGKKNAADGGKWGVLKWGEGFEVAAGSEVAAGFYVAAGF